MATTLTPEQLQHLAQSEQYTKSAQALKGGATAEEARQISTSGPNAPINNPSPEFANNTPLPTAGETTTQESAFTIKAGTKLQYGGKTYPSGTLITTNASLANTSSNGLPVLYLPLQEYNKVVTSGAGQGGGESAFQPVQAQVTTFTPASHPTGTPLGGGDTVILQTGDASIKTFPISTAYGKGLADSRGNVYILDPQNPSSGQYILLRDYVNNTVKPQQQQEAFQKTNPIVQYAVEATTALGQIGEEATTKTLEILGFKNYSTAPPPILSKTLTLGEKEQSLLPASAQRYDILSGNQGGKAQLTEAGATALDILTVAPIPIGLATKLGARIIPKVAEAVGVELKVDPNLARLFGIKTAEEKLAEARLQKAVQIEGGGAKINQIVTGKAKFTFPDERTQIVESIFPLKVTPSGRVLDTGRIEILAGQPNKLPIAPRQLNVIDRFMASTGAIPQGAFFRGFTVQTALKPATIPSYQLPLFLSGVTGRRQIVREIGNFGVDEFGRPIRVRYVEKAVTRPIDFFGTRKVIPSLKIIPKYKVPEKNLLVEFFGPEVQLGEASKGFKGKSGVTIFERKVSGKGTAERSRVVIPIISKGEAVAKVRISGRTVEKSTSKIIQPEELQTIFAEGKVQSVKFETPPTIDEILILRQLEGQGKIKIITEKSASQVAGVFNPEPEIVGYKVLNKGKGLSVEDVLSLNSRNLVVRRIGGKKAIEIPYLTNEESNIIYGERTIRRVKKIAGREPEITFIEQTGKPRGTSPSGYRVSRGKVKGKIVSFSVAGQEEIINPRLIIKNGEVVSEGERKFVVADTRFQRIDRELLTRVGKKESKLQQQNVIEFLTTGKYEKILNQQKAELKRRLDILSKTPENVRIATARVYRYTSPETKELERTVTQKPKNYLYEVGGEKIQAVKPFQRLTQTEVKTGRGVSLLTTEEKKAEAVTGNEEKLRKVSLTVPRKFRPREEAKSEPQVAVPIVRGRGATKSESLIRLTPVESTREVPLVENRSESSVKNITEAIPSTATENFLGESTQNVTRPALSTRNVTNTNTSTVTQTQTNTVTQTVTRPVPTTKLFPTTKTQSTEEKRKKKRIEFIKGRKSTVKRTEGPFSDLLSLNFSVIRYRKSTLPSSRREVGEKVRKLEEGSLGLFPTRETRNLKRGIKII